MRLAVARRAARERFEAELDNEHVALDRACLWIAAEERPTPWPHRALDELDRMADALRMPPGASVFDAVARLNVHLFRECGFHGDVDDYYAPRNSCLDQVLHLRRGQPILLSVVYIEVARRCGVEVAGIGFPGHFVVEPVISERRFYLDPFEGGRVLRDAQLRARLNAMADGAVTEEAFAWCTRRVSNRSIVARICNNLKSAWLRRGDLEGALRASERLLAIQPGRFHEHRDRAVLLARLGRQSQAARALRAYLALAPAGTEPE